MTEQENQSAFPDARIHSEGFFATPHGSMVNTNYVDLSGTLPLDGLCLAKATEPRFELTTTQTIPLSRPGVFRDTGEVLVKDEQEGLARQETQEVNKRATNESMQTERRVRALNASLRLGDTKISVKTTNGKVKNTKTHAEWMTFGNDWLIYCTSISPPNDEKAAWRETFPASYTTVSHIYRPTQFAQALGIGVCEHIGATGKAEPMRGTFHGFKTVEVHRTSQLVVHGPVLYVDDPYRCIAETEAGWPRLCSMIFVKSREYAAQREYRFAILPVPPEAGEIFDLPVSGMLRDCLEPMKVARDAAICAVKVSPDESGGTEERQTSHGYTYRRTRTRRESTNAGSDAPDTDRTKEEIVEETVTSPDAVPDPFPPDEQPDVIIVDRVGGELRFLHKAYRDEETYRWRIETARANPEAHRRSQFAQSFRGTGGTGRRTAAVPGRGSGPPWIRA